jgi:hypothetical protein
LLYYPVDETSVPRVFYSLTTTILVYDFSCTFTSSTPKVWVRLKGHALPVSPFWGFG